MDRLGLIRGRRSWNDCRLLLHDRTTMRSCGTYKLTFTYTQVTLKGYNDKLPLLAKMLFSIMANFGSELDEASFRNVLEKVHNITPTECLHLCLLGTHIITGSFQHLLAPLEMRMRENHAVQITWYAQYLREDGVWDIETFLNAARCRSCAVAPERGLLWRRTTLMRNDDSVTGLGHEKVCTESIQAYLCARTHPRKLYRKSIPTLPRTIH